MSNAIQGKRLENFVKNQISNHALEITPLLLSNFDHLSTSDRILTVARVGSEQEKSDVFIRFVSEQLLAASVKSFAEHVGFNQVVRASIGKFCHENGLSEPVNQRLIECTIRKARNRREKWIDPVSERIILPEIHRNLNQIIKFSFCGSDNPHLLILVTSTRPHRMVFYDMAQFVQDMIQRSDVKITPRGVIQLNEFLTIQRKGGNGKRSAHIPKDEITHPGNNIQVKLKTTLLMNSDVSRIYESTLTPSGSLA